MALDLSRPPTNTILPRSRDMLLPPPPDISNYGNQKNNAIQPPAAHNKSHIAQPLLLDLSVKPSHGPYSVPVPAHSGPSVRPPPAHIALPAHILHHPTQPNPRTAIERVPGMVSPRGLLRPYEEHSRMPMPMELSSHNGYYPELRVPQYPDRYGATVHHKVSTTMHHFPVESHHDDSLMNLQRMNKMHPTAINPLTVANEDYRDPSRQAEGKPRGSVYKPVLPPNAYYDARMNRPLHPGMDSPMRMRHPAPLRQPNILPARPNNVMYIPVSDHQPQNPHHLASPQGQPFLFSPTRGGFPPRNQPPKPSPPPASVPIQGRPPLAATHQQQNRMPSHSQHTGQNMPPPLKRITPQLNSYRQQAPPVTKVPCTVTSPVSNHFVSQTWKMPMEEAQARQNKRSDVKPYPSKPTLPQKRPIPADSRGPEPKTVCVVTGVKQQSNNIFPNEFIDPTTDKKLANINEAVREYMASANHPLDQVGKPMDTLGILNLSKRIDDHKPAYKSIVQSFEEFLDQEVNKAYLKETEEEAARSKEQNHHCEKSPSPRVTNSPSRVAKSPSSHVPKSSLTKSPMCVMDLTVNKPSQPVSSSANSKTLTPSSLSESREIVPLSPPAPLDQTDSHSPPKLILEKDEEGGDQTEYSTSTLAPIDSNENTSDEITEEMWGFSLDPELAMNDSQTEDMDSQEMQKNEKIEARVSKGTTSNTEQPSSVDSIEDRDEAMRQLGLERSNKSEVVK